MMDLLTTNPKRAGIQEFPCRSPIDRDEQAVHRNRSNRANFGTRLAISSRKTPYGRKRLLTVLQMDSPIAESFTKWIGKRSGLYSRFFRHHRRIHGKRWLFWRFLPDS